MSDLIEMVSFTEQLEQMNACTEAIEWVNGRSLRKCWQVADRSDWMLWLLNKLNICETELHELACDFAERTLKYVPNNEERPRIAIETKRRWLRGDASDEELTAAGTAARAAARASWAASWAAARAAESAAGTAAGTAAGAASWAAGTAAGAAEGKAQRRLIRKRIPVEVIEQALTGEQHE